MGYTSRATNRQRPSVTRAWLCWVLIVLTTNAGPGLCLVSASPWSLSPVYPATLEQPCEPPAAPLGSSLTYLSTCDKPTALPACCRLQESPFKVLGCFHSHSVTYKDCVMCNAWSEDQYLGVSERACICHSRLSRGMESTW